MSKYDDAPAAYKEAVKRGAKLLDKLIPGWHQRMRPEKLVMSDVNLCAMGQLFGHKTEMAIAKEMYPDLWKKCDGYMNRCGFGIAMNAGMVSQLITKIFKTKASYVKAVKEYGFLKQACGGDDSLKCCWAYEVAERVASDDTEAA